ncbi:Uma2 family endonuclease [Lamprobacter modestohalophilus]|uniref:Uma2 family endonuclease n=1 Tax=Lamprobacter modestohalophilus TaxID=1064514 RepID=UPI002ADEC7C5|nr:Uma2 family endonuclease [Lamprobacter modestohalophilus]MEA1049085.1 Uma2 family endonuclease [Lamprobacter modestohalophilus]
MPVVEAEPTLAEARPIFRLGVDAYHQMIHAGIFDEDDRVELIDGELRAMPPINPDHAGKNKRLNRLLSLRVGDRALVSVQDPLTLAPRSEPEPDLMLLRPRDDFYEGANPTPADVLLVIEICNSSLQYDREVKVPLYAAHRVPEVWLVDLQHRRLELYREPGSDGYRLILRPELTEVVTPLLLPSLHIRVEEIW